MLAYNGKHGKNMKYMFYWFYPVHLAVLFFIKMNISMSNLRFFK